MKLLAIVQGDTTDHGGSVINGDQTKRINGFPVAHRGCDVICPLHGTSKIIGEENNFHIEGNIIALEGDLTSCGARLISRQQSFFRVERRSSVVQSAPDPSVGNDQEAPAKVWWIGLCIQLIRWWASESQSCATNVFVCSIKSVPAWVIWAMW